MALEPDRESCAALFHALAGTFLQGRLILGGSSGLLGFATEAPAFTEDLDLLIREDFVIERGEEVVKTLQAIGYERTPDTATFSAPGRPTFDLVGYSPSDLTDHLSPAGALRVMVFRSLSKLLEGR